jgi:hypothetical protein
MNLTLTNTVKRTYNFLGEVRTRTQISNFQNCRLCKFAFTVFSTFGVCGSARKRPVFGIVRASADVEVPRINTAQMSIIALVQNPKPCWNWSDIEFIGNSVGKVGFMFYTDGTVPVPIAVGRPQPTPRIRLGSPPLVKSFFQCFSHVSSITSSRGDVNA